MNIMQRRVWQACGWTACALATGVTGAIITVATDPDAPRYLGLLAACLSVAAAVLAGLRVVIPHVARLSQQIDLNLGQQRRVLDALEQDPKPLHLVTEDQDTAPPDNVAAMPGPGRRRKTRSA